MQTGERDSAQNILCCIEKLTSWPGKYPFHPVKPGECKVSKGKGILAHKHIRGHYRPGFLKRVHVNTHPLKRVHVKEVVLLRYSSWVTFSALFRAKARYRTEIQKKFLCLLIIFFRGT